MAYNEVGIGATFATAGIQIDGGSLVQTLWQRKLRLEVLNDTFFADLTSSLDTKTYKMDSNVIMRSYEKPRPGQEEIVVPMTMALTDGGLIGGLKDLRSNEEVQEYRFWKGKFNTLQKGVSSREKGLSAFLVKGYAFYERVYPDLKVWWAVQKELDCIEALVEGANPVLTDPTDGVGVAKQLHPNLFVPTGSGIGAGGTGRVTFNTTVATYRTNANSAFKTVEAAATDGNMDLLFLDELSYFASQVARVKPLPIVEIGGHHMFYCLLHPAQAHQLQNDSTTKDLFRDADVRGAQNRAISKAYGIYRNLILVELQRAPSIATGASDFTVTYDDHTPGNKGSDDLKIGFIVGADALAEAVAEELSFEKDYYSYRTISGVGTLHTYGVQRPEWQQESTAAVDGREFLYNQGSLMFATKSPTLG